MILQLIIAKVLKFAMHSRQYFWILSESLMSIGGIIELVCYGHPYATCFFTV